MAKINREKRIVRTSIIGILGNILLVTFKAIIGIIANSISIIIDAVNNLTDALSSLITIIGTKFANRKPDKKHPYGHGKVEYLTSLIIGVIILIAGTTAIIEGIQSIVDNAKPDHNHFSIIIVSSAIAVKILLGLFFRKVGKETSSEALKASGIDALFDALLSTATLVGVIFAITLDIYIEGYLAILIGLFIIKSGIEVLRNSTSNLIGERVDADTSHAIKQLICSHPEVIGAYDLILNNYGPNYSIGSIHIEVDGNMTAEQIHPLTKAITYEVYEKFGVILTLGIYANDSSHPEIKQMREYINKLVLSRDYIKEIHAFYVDVEKKIISFDIIIYFQSEDPKDVLSNIKKEVEDKYPGYTCEIVYDADFAD